MSTQWCATQAADAAAAEVMDMLEVERDRLHEEWDLHQQRMALGLMELDTLKAVHYDT